MQERRRWGRRHLQLRTRILPQRSAGDRVLRRPTHGPRTEPSTDSCDREGIHWVTFHFPIEGPAEFIDSFGRAPETYYPCFRSVLIANGPQYKLNTVGVQPEDGDTCGLYCVQYRYRDFTLEDITTKFSAHYPRTIEAKLKDICELIVCTTTIYIE